MRRTPDLSAAAKAAEDHARAFYRREKEMNESFEQRNPHLRPTAAYAEVALSPRLPMFGAGEQYWRYRAYRELGKYDPQVTFPTPSAPRIPLGRR